MYQPRSGLLAVVDVETTGLSRNRDRVIELAAVVIDAGGEIVSEFESLINPERDVGPTRIHGVTAEDVQDAPRFADVAGLFVNAMTGVVALAGHNVRFDVGFLEAEFRRIGSSMPQCCTICTMRYTGRKSLDKCCEEFGIPLPAESHHALADARATAYLLSHFLHHDGEMNRCLQALHPIDWPFLPVTGKPLLTRREAHIVKRDRPTYIQRVLDRARCQPRTEPCSNNIEAYHALLDRVLEDRLITGREADVLAEWVDRFGLSLEEVELAHRSYLTQLAEVALEDGIVTDSERQDLLRVARELGRPEEEVLQILSCTGDHAQNHAGTIVSRNTNVDSLVGKSVCFTGELRCRYQGMPISRALAERLAASAGLKVEPSVTKRLDILVLADAHSQSGKARKAREYGIRIMHETVFWRAIGVPVE